MTKGPMSFNLACRDFFGMKPGQKPADFVAEIRSLSDHGKVFIHNELVYAGYVIQK